MNKTKIDYADYTWNPVTGCTRGCDFCYARRIAQRFGWSFEPTFHPKRLEELWGCKRPSRILVCSMGELFDPGVLFDDVSRVWKYMWLADRHTYLVLTKRPERMMEFVKEYVGKEQTVWWDHVWLGVSVTCQADADERIPLLLQTPAAYRWVSAEPLLGEVDLSQWLAVERLQMPWSKHWTEQTGDVSRLNWVVVGAQTGPGAVPPRREWVQSIVDQCRAAGVPVFLKGNLRQVWAGELIQEYPR